MKVYLSLCFILMFSILSCDNIANKFPSGNLYEEKVQFEFAVYLEKNPGIDFNSVAKKIITGQSMELMMMDEPSKDLTFSQASIIVPDKIESYPPPGADYLKYAARGINENEFKKIQDSKFCAVFDFYSSKKNLVKTMKNASELLKMIAIEYKGYIWDEFSRECFSTDYWINNRLNGLNSDDIDIKKQINVHFYKSGDYYRLITVGMQKFGLPDVVVNDLTANDARLMNNLINLVCQTLMEKGTIEKEGRLFLDIDGIRNKEFKKNLATSFGKNAGKKIEIDIVNGKKEEGDPDNRLMEIYFKDRPGRNKQVEQDKILGELFGTDDSVVSVKHDAKLLEVSRKAKEKLPEIKRLFGNGLKPGEYVLVSLPFKRSDNGENEWMWVEVSGWKEDKITGILQNDPYYVSGLRAGARVTGDEKDVFDYIHYLPDGSQEGNETGKIMEEENKIK